MSHRAFHIAVGIALATTSMMALAIAQTPQRPVRDIRHETVGTGVIAGIVVEDGAGTRPMRRAAVQLSSDALMTSRRFITLDDGSFRFDGLPPGKYALTASSTGFMSTEYGAQRQGGTGSAIALEDGQRLTGINLRLSRYGAITGVVYDQTGEPAPNISVEAMRYTMRTGTRTLSSVYGQPSTTDDRGVYRLAGLLPGDYYVAAGPSPDRGLADLQVLTTGDVDRALQILASPASNAGDITFEEPRQGFAPVFFPGTPDRGRAQIITLAQGEQRAGVDVRLQLVRMARIQGTVTAPDGRPLGELRVFAWPLGDASSLDLFSPMAVMPVITGAGGAFVFPAVPPGGYLLSVGSRPFGPPTDTPAPQQWASAELAVDGTDLRVNLTLQPGATISGKVSFNGTLSPPTNLGEIRIRPVDVKRQSSPFFDDPMAAPLATVRPDGTFVLMGEPPGRFRLTVTTPNGWSLRSAFVDGVDTLDMPVAIRPGQTIDNAMVVFTDKPTELSGTLQSPAGAPTADFFIIVFAADKSFWTASSRRNAMARPTSDGKYSFKNLPPGEYMVAAVTDAEPGDWWNPAWLEPLAAVASKITLSEGEKKALDLKIGG